MFTARILLILNAPLQGQTAAETITRALETAVRPSSLRFAVPAALGDSLGELPEGISPLVYDASLGLAGVLPLLTDETHFLFLTGPHAFAPRWDSTLHGLWRSHGKRSLFTGSITPCALPDTQPNETATLRVPVLNGNRIAALRQALPALQKRRSLPAEEPKGILPHLPVQRRRAATPTTSEAHLPALKEVQADGDVIIGRGLPLVCATAPVRTLVIDPALLFGPVSFLLESEPSDETLSLSAYMSGFQIYALHAAILWPLQMQPRRLMRLPSPETLPGTTLSRFEQLLGFHAGQQQCSAKAAMGLFGLEDTYPQRLPSSLILPQKTRSARMKLLETHMPLMVSAFIDLPNPRVDSAFYLLRFGFLRRVESLPLLLYTGGNQERALRASFPNTQSYPDSSLLPRAFLQAGMKPEEHFARSKVHLMQRAAKRRVEFTHAAWVDMDTLPHPVCREAVPNFDPLMDNRIHIATVNGIPDPSFFVAPVELLAPLARLAQSITQLDAELKRGFGEALLWERIFQKKPEWFAIHRMPRRRLLFLSAFDPQLLSQSVQPLLADLPEPYYATQADASPKIKFQKESPLNVQ